MFFNAMQNAWRKEEEMKNLFFYFFFICFVFFIPACGGSFLESDSDDSISVMGTVLTHDGSSAQGARVLVHDVGVPSTPAAITEMVVDKNGNFSGVIYGVDYSEIRLVIEAEGYTTAVYPPMEYFPIVITIGMPIDFATIVLKKTIVAKKEV